MALVSAPTLLVMSIDGTIHPHQVTVDSSPFAVGRDISNNLALSDINVSRRHLTFIEGTSAWSVERLPGTTPLFVNGIPQDHADVQSGDQIVIGGVVMRIQMPAAVSPGTPQVGA